MKVIASVQSKRGSSRGLVHYIAHSKIDTAREPEKGRELFNAFADELSVKSANNSIKADILLARPSNDELHHLVLSFRAEDYKALGRDEKQRRAALKETTRASMKSLEATLDANRISWAAAVHLNTENPHVHIAIQKEFMRKDLDTQVMTKIPREALPHFEVRDGGNVLTPGILIEAATEKMEKLIAIERERTREPEQTRSKSASISRGKSERETDSNAPKKTNDERDILRRGILVEQELNRIESRIETLTEHGNQMRFRVTDPMSGQKRRLSLHDLEQRGAVSDTPSSTPAERQIRTILLKMLTKEETAKEGIQKFSADAIREANEVRKLYKKNGWKLPIASLTKDELDKLQDHCLEDSNIRKFSYLEGIRTDLERSGEIEPRNEKDLHRLAAEKTISEMRGRLFEKNRLDLIDKQYYRLVDIGGKRISLARLDRDQNTSTNPASVFTQKMKETALRLVGKQATLPPPATGKDRLRSDIASKLNEELSGIGIAQKTEESMSKMLGKILKTSGERISGKTEYSSEQLAEIDALSLRLKLKEHYEKSWDGQRALIEAAGAESAAARKLLNGSPNASFDERKTSIVAGRTLAREIVAKVEFERAREDLNVFTESSRFRKFAVTDKETGEVAFLSLHDVDLPRRGSVLDRAMQEIFEGREHRALRRTVAALVKDREQRLREELGVAKEILVSAGRYADEFKRSSFFGLGSDRVYNPIFTSSEIAVMETRAFNAADPKEAARLEKILESASDEQPRSLQVILRDFENPQPVSAQEKERDPAVKSAQEHPAGVATEHQIRTHVKAEKAKEPKFHGHSR